MWWLITAVVCTIAGLFFATCFAFAISDYGDNKGMFVVAMATTVIVIYAIANSMTYTKTSEHEFRAATFAEAASLYDFSSGSEYPLEIGGRSVSANSEAAVRSGAFVVSAYIRVQAGTSILVDHQYPDGSHEVLEVPLSKVKFNFISDSEMSSMTIDFGAVSGSVPEYTAEDVPGDCHTHIRWGWWTSECATIDTKVTSSTNEGVAGLLQKALASNPGKFIVMNVRETEYRQILGSAGSATETETETPTPSPAQR